MVGNGPLLNNYASTCIQKRKPGLNSVEKRTYRNAKCPRQQKTNVDSLFMQAYTREVCLLTVNRQPHFEAYSARFLTLGCLS